LEKVFCKIEIDDFRSVVRVSFSAHIQRGASNQHARSLGPKPQLAAQLRLSPKPTPQRWDGLSNVIGSGNVELSDSRDYTNKP
jgi:hypothetical protein